jgi:hypothetical protein
LFGTILAYQTVGTCFIGYSLAVHVADIRLKLAFKGFAILNNQMTRRCNFCLCRSRAGTFGPADVLILFDEGAALQQGSARENGQ